MDASIGGAGRERVFIKPWKSISLASFSFFPLELVGESGTENASSQ